jgi:hypothetical protein
VNVQGHQVSAEGVTPGGDVVVFFVARERTTWVTHVARETHVLRDDDNDGTVVLQREPAFHSVWCVVDLATGEYAVSVPEGFPRKERAFRSDAFSAAPGGGVKNLNDDRGYVEVLLVRPRVGVWRASAGDGAASDDDGTRDGQTSISFANMQSVEGAPSAPTQLALGDTIVVVNPRNLEFSATQMTAEGE